MAAKPDERPPAEAARLLLRGAAKASLGTVDAGGQGGGSGAPFVSLVTIATDHSGAPLLLLSRLAEHRRNILADDRVALLVDGTAGHANPQGGPRATFTGRIAVSADPAHRARFLARHPAAMLYAGFSDFEILRVAVERVHWVGGFARAAWLDFVPTPPEAAQAIGEAEAGILDHMNADHADAVQRYAAILLKRRGRAWRMAGCDSDGCDLVQGSRMVRLTFDRPARTAGEIRERLVQMAQAARLPSP